MSPRYVVIALSVALSACAGLIERPMPVTAGEAASGYTYVPIDPNRVNISMDSCRIDYDRIGVGANKIGLLGLLPDNAVRMSMEVSDAGGKITYGTSKLEASGAYYRLTADYVNSDTVNKNFWIRRTLMAVQQKEGRDDKGVIFKAASVARVGVSVRGEIGMENYRGANRETIDYMAGTDSYDVRSSRPEQIFAGEYEEFNIPIYVGIGLRIVAEGRSLKSNANISGIGVVGAEAEAKNLIGSLTVQTLGVNSQAVASALPVQSELSRTTAENAFVAIGSIKAMLHQTDTIKTPRVVGLYLPIPGGKPLVNAIISELSKSPVFWCPNGYALSN